MSSEVAIEMKSRWARYYEDAPRPDHCIYCDHERVHWNGSRTRTASILTSEGIVHLPDVRCRRVKCAACRRSWTLRPAGLAADRHYQLCAVAAGSERYLTDGVASGTSVAAAFSVSRRTVMRWVRWVSRVCPIAQLQSCVQRATAQASPPLPLPVARAGEVSGTAAKALTLLESLAMALGLEPPGLRSVVELATAHGARSIYRDPEIPDLARRLQRGTTVKLLM